jgi:hypothetical protein
LSDASAVTVTFPDTVAPAPGAVTVTAGNVVSGAVVLNDTDVPDPTIAVLSDLAR